mgnify:CR=1 FL=1
MSNPQQKQPNDKSSQSNAANTNAQRSDGKSDMSKNESGTKPAGENRSQSREGVDAPRTEQNRPAGKPSPQYDDRPGQQRGGPGDAKNPDAPLPGTKTPNYGDKEPGDPRHLDVDAGGKNKSGDRAQAGSTQGASKDKGADKSGGRSDDSTQQSGGRGKSS